MSRRILHAAAVGPIVWCAVACDASGGGAPDRVPGGGQPEAGVADAGADRLSLLDVFSGEPGLDPDAACVAEALEAERMPVDIVFVVDTSGSMSDEIAQVQANINAFSAAIAQSGLDYRVVMIGQKGTTGITVCVPPPLGGPNCSNEPPTFYHVNQVVASTDALSLILSTFNSSDPAISWNKFTRFDSHKVLIVVTDDNSALPHQSFDSQLLAKTPSGVFGTTAHRRYTFHSICGWDDGTPFLTGPKCSTAYNIGIEYQKLSTLTGGIIDSVCKLDYSGVLQNLAQGITTKLSCELAVPQMGGGPVDPSMVAVRFTPPGEEPRLLEQLTDGSKCKAGSESWYYDDPAQPTRIVLCAETCSAINAGAGGRLEILAGCPTPPPT